MRQRKKKLQENLHVSKRNAGLRKKDKKKYAPGKFYKQSKQNIAYFNKEQRFIIENKQKFDKILHYWLKISENNKYLTKRFQRHTLFAVKNNFVM